MDENIDVGEGMELEFNKALSFIPTQPLAASPAPSQVWIPQDHLHRHPCFLLYLPQSPSLLLLRDSVSTSSQVPGTTQRQPSVTKRIV